MPDVKDLLEGKHFDELGYKKLLYPSTLYPYTPLPFYSSTPLPLYPSTTLPLYLSTLLDTQSCWCRKSPEVSSPTLGEDTFYCRLLGLLGSVGFFCLCC